MIKAVGGFLSGTIREQAVQNINVMLSIGPASDDKFSCCRAQNVGAFIKTRKFLDFALSPDAVRVLATTIEYLSAEILEVAGNIARAAGKQIVSCTDLENAIKSHKDISFILAARFEQISKLSLSELDDQLKTCKL